MYLRQDGVLGAWGQVFATPPDELTPLGESMLTGLRVP